MSREARCPARNTTGRRALAVRPHHRSAPGDDGAVDVAFVIDRHTLGVRPLGIPIHRVGEGRQEYVDRARQG